MNEYLGMEIPRSTELGLDPNKIYRMLRDPEELKKGAATFARLPILSKHVPINTKSFPNELVVGTIGTDVEYIHPFIYADTCFWTEEAIAGIETDTVREFSCAYHYVAVMTSGIYEGEKYDGIMTEIEANHLAQVEAGRVGPEAMAADSKLEIPQMIMTKLGKALFVAISAAAPKLALDAAFPAVVGGLTKKTFDKPAVRAKLLALDAEMPKEKVDAVMDALEDMDEPAAKDAEAHPKDCDCKDCKMGKDAEAEEKDKTAKDNIKAMDARIATVKRELHDADEARRAVRDTVGEVVAADSAENIYTLALDHLKVDHAGITELAGLKALYKLASVKSDTVPVTLIAQDHAGAVAMFPDLARF